MITPVPNKLANRKQTPWPVGKPANSMNTSASSLWSTEANCGTPASRSLPAYLNGSHRLSVGRGRGRGTPASATSLEAQRLITRPGFNLGSPVNRGRGARVRAKDGSLVSLRLNRSETGVVGGRNLSQQLAGAARDDSPLDGLAPVAPPSSPVSAALHAAAETDGANEQTATSDEENF